MAKLLVRRPHGSPKLFLPMWNNYKLSCYFYASTTHPSCDLITPNFFPLHTEIRNRYDTYVFSTPFQVVY
ncbi:hypothetical protein Hanom_Chr04g00300611 [Helianthus anomalus]